MNKKTTQILIIAIAAIIIVYLIATNIEFLSNVVVNLPAGGEPSQNGQGDTYYYQDGRDTTNSLAPTSLAVQISPNPMTMGGWFYGTVTSNGYNYPITVYGKNRGSGEVVSFGAFLGADGKYEHTQQLNTPGYYEFWATADGLTSNKAQLTVRGILVTASASHYSHTFPQIVTVKVYSHHTSVNAPLYANDPAHAASIYITNLAMSNLGFCEVSVDFASFANGDYELDTMIHGERAVDYGGSFWLRVGR